MESEPGDAAEVKSSLRRLAGPADEQIIERASDAVDDLDAAKVFVEHDGISELETAVDRVDDPELTARGQRVIEAFERFSRAAVGEETDDHFHSGRGTDLRSNPEGTIQ